MTRSQIVIYKLCLISEPANNAPLFIMTLKVHTQLFLTKTLLHIIAVVQFVSLQLFSLDSPSPLHVSGLYCANNCLQNLHDYRAIVGYRMICNYIIIIRTLTVASGWRASDGVTYAQLICA